MTATRGLAKVLEIDDAGTDVVGRDEDLRPSRSRRRPASRPGASGSLPGPRTGDVKYALCNADEGDPGAFMDRSVLEGDPFSLIEGMTIAGYTIGRGPKATSTFARNTRLRSNGSKRAIEIAKERGLLGDNILGSKFCFNLEIRMGSGAFVCGEETAPRIASIEGPAKTPANRARVLRSPPRRVSGTSLRF